VFVLFLPIFDINLVVWTRLSEGRSPVEGGKDHTSHRIMVLGFNQRRTTLILYGLCMFFGMLAVLISAAAPDVGARLGVAGFILIAVLYSGMIWIRQTYQKKA
jgi:UDP-GlcNAc:undecaprenyl-phosphate/decaprenyl-phosphate GlcNAc-1-phosphate transferase